MKFAKLTALLLALVMLLALVSCGIDVDDETGEESLDINEEQAKEKMAALAANDGYLLTYTFSDDSGSNGSQTVGKKGNAVWMISPEASDNFAYVKGETEVAVYDYEDGEWVFSSTMSNELANSSIGNFELYTTDIWLFYANLYDGMLKKGDDTTICGRPCYTYTFGYNISVFGQSAGFSYKAAVDKELGITLSLDIETNDNEESVHDSFRVTEFKTGKDVVVPNFPAATSLLDTLGLTVDDFKCEGIASASAMTKGPESVTISATPAADSQDSFNTWCEHVYNAVKNIADEGVKDAQGETITEWKPLAQGYTGFYFAIDSVNYQISLSNAYEGLGYYLAAIGLD